MTPRTKRIQVLAGIAFLLLITSLPVTAQNGFQGEHEYRGNQEGNTTGSFTGTINDGAVVMNQETIQSVIEYRLFSVSELDGAGEHIYNIDPTPFQVGDVDSNVSKTRLEVFAFTGTGNPVNTVDFQVEWQIDAVLLENASNCNTSTTQVRIGGPSGIEGGAAGGAGESRMFCDLDDHRTSTFTIEADVTTQTNTWGTKLGVTVWQTEIINITRPGNSGTITGNVSGTTSGTYDGNHSGFIEQINATADVNQTQFENITTNNLTFSNLFGSITVEELDFWIPVVFFTLAAWFFFSRDATWAGLASILGIIVSITNLPAWSIAASLLLIIISITAEYLTKRVWKTNKQTM